MATPQHTPYGRGFNTSFLDYQHANDYWNKKTGIQATGEITTCLNAFYDIMVENDTYRGPYTGSELTDVCKHSEERSPACYEEKMFEDYSLQVIKNHDASDEEHPLFLFHAFSPAAHALAGAKVLLRPDRGERDLKGRPGLRFGEPPPHHGHDEAGLSLRLAIIGIYST